jgi:L-ribulokinase
LAGAHRDFASAEAAMTSLRPEAFEPIAENQVIYDQLYELYRELHDSFGGLSKSADLSQVMKSLLDIKYAQRG